MFGLFNKKKEEAPIDFSAIHTDMHSHLLPGIDDGAADINASVELIAGLQQLGFKKIITTPHIYWDMYKNTPDIIHRELDVLQKHLHQNGVDIEIQAAAEYFLDEHVEGLLRKKERLLTLKDNIILTEFSTMHMSISMKEILFDLLMAGYQPILAHPERYAYLYKQWDIFHEIKNNGVYFQLNLLSLAGGYGKTVMEMAEYFLKNNFYSVLGTDTHHIGHINRLKTLKAGTQLQALINSGSLLNPTL